MTDKHMAYFEANKLREGEIVTATMKGYVPSGKKDNNTDALFGGRVILTNERVCYLRKGLMGEAFETIDLPQIRSVEAKSFLGHRTVRLFSTRNDLTVKSFEKKEAFNDFVSKTETAMATAKSAPSSEVGQNKQSAVEQLEKLAALHQSGILSDAEFSEKKTELLSRI